jgi:hypothetical protein
LELAGWQVEFEFIRRKKLGKGGEVHLQGQLQQLVAACKKGSRQIKEKSWGRVAFW